MFDILQKNKLILYFTQYIDTQKNILVKLQSLKTNTKTLPPY